MWPVVKWQVENAFWSINFFFQSICQSPHITVQHFVTFYNLGFLISVVSCIVYVNSFQSPLQNQTISVWGLAFSESFILQQGNSVCACVFLWVVTLVSPCVFHYRHSYYFQPNHTHISTYTHVMLSIPFCFSVLFFPPLFSPLPLPLFDFFPLYQSTLFRHFQTSDIIICHYMQNGCKTSLIYCVVDLIWSIHT